MSEDKKKPIVYFDGDCPMCRAFVPWVDEPKKEDSAQFENLRTANLPNEIKLEEATEKIHVVTESGEILKGAKAVFKILETNHKFVWFAKFGQLPLVSSIAEVVYAIIAKNRFLIFDPNRKTSRTIIFFVVTIFIGLLVWNLVK